VTGGVGQDQVTSHSFYHSLHAKLEIESDV